MEYFGKVGLRVFSLARTSAGEPQKADKRKRHSGPGSPIEGGSLVHSFRHLQSF